jgi:hypothetical protein
VISSQPIAAADGVLDFRSKVDAFVAVARARAADGITVAEFAELAVALLRVAIAAADGLAAPGATKKDWVVGAVAALFDATADQFVPAIVWPVWLVVRPAVRQLVLLAAAGAVESLLPLVRAAR